MTRAAEVLETPIMRAALVNLTAPADWMFWRNNTGLFRSLDGSRIVRIGVKGAADILGSAAGRAVAVETKTNVGQLSKEQGLWAAAFRKAGGLYLVVRNPDEAVPALVAALRSGHE